MSHAEEAVELRRLDSFMDDRRVSFIKMDGEGAEPRLVMGAQALLARDRPSFSPKFIITNCVR